MTPQPPAAPRKSNGCLIAVGVVVAIAALTCLVGGVIAWRLSKNPELAKAFGVIGKSVKLAVDGTKARGAEELRQAGCPQAMVLDAAQMASIVDEFVDAGSTTLHAEHDEDLGLMVLCQGTLGSSLPSCDDVARVYVKAALPTRPFMVTVQEQGTRQGNCSAKYDPNGERVPAK
jgi:hypothetical protein